MLIENEDLLKSFLLECLSLFMLLSRSTIDRIFDWIFEIISSSITNWSMHFKLGNFSFVPLGNFSGVNFIGKGGYQFNFLSFVEEDSINNLKSFANYSEDRKRVFWIILPIKGLFIWGYLDSKSPFRNKNLLQDIFCLDLSTFWRKKTLNK